MTWDKEKVLEDLKSFPLPPPLINWQKFAWEHDVPGRNCGQVVKEFVQQSGIDTFQLDNRAPATRSHSEKRKMPGGEISASADPAPATIKGEWQKMVESGELSLGVPCAPYKLVRYTPKQGQLDREEITITGRKFPLLEV